MKPETVSTQLYTAEATESRTQAQADVSVPDPDEATAQKAIAEATIESEPKKLAKARAIAERCKEAGVTPPTWVSQMLRRSV